MVYQMPKIFPNDEVKNLVICVSGVGSGKDFSVLISELLPEVHTISTGQCFPLKIFEEESDSGKSNDTQSLFDDPLTSLEAGRFRVRDGITDAGLKHFDDVYLGDVKAKPLTKEDLFYPARGNANF